MHKVEHVSTSDKAKSDYGPGTQVLKGRMCEAAPPAGDCGSCCSLHVEIDKLNKFRG